MNRNPFESPKLPGSLSNSSFIGRWSGTVVRWGLIALGLMILVGLLLPAQRVSRELPRRTQCQNNIKQIALAMHNYESRHKRLPPAFTVDENGRPLHSWRALLLPYLDAQDVFDKIDFSKPWDDPANAEARKAQIPHFVCPSLKGKLPDGHCVYQVVMAADGCFRGNEPIRLGDLKDGVSETLLVIEVRLDQATHWMSPGSIEEAEALVGTPAPKVGERRTRLQHSGGFNVALADGSVMFVPETVTRSNLRAMISIAAGDKPNWDW